MPAGAAPPAWADPAGAGHPSSWTRWAAPTRPRSSEPLKVWSACRSGRTRRRSRRRRRIRSRKPRPGRDWLRCWAPEAEQRPGQSDYAGAATAAFTPRETRGDPHLVLAEAGTGTGKTLGYLAPASVWAEKNKGAVWISTYTRHLQRQIDGEARPAVSPTRPSGARRVVDPQGPRELLCLLNLEDAVNTATAGFMQQQPFRWA